MLVNIPVNCPSGSGEGTVDGRWTTSDAWRRLPASLFNASLTAANPVSSAMFQGLFMVLATRLLGAGSTETTSVRIGLYRFG